MFIKEELIVLEGVKFRIFWLDSSQKDRLLEAKSKGRYLVGQYSYDIHQPHNPTGEHHIHLYDQNKEILSMNRDSGTAHDGYHGVRIPNKAYVALKKKFPDWKWPGSNQILESSDFTYFSTHLTGAVLRPVRVSPHKDFWLEEIDGFIGFFHQFANVPFNAGKDGWKVRTVALVETEDGKIVKVDPGKLKFIDIDQDSANTTLLRN